MFSLTLTSLCSNGALAVGHTPLGIGSSGRPGLNVSYVERAGVGWRIGDFHGPLTNNTNYKYNDGNQPFS